MRKLEDTAFWIYTAGAGSSLLLGAYALAIRQGIVADSVVPFLNSVEPSRLAVILMTVTLLFGLAVAMPIMRYSNRNQEQLTSHAAKLEVEVVTDPLTGLYNRRYFNQVLEEYLAEFNRINAPLAILALDLDHFKSVNDTYGHDAGDVVLKQLALRLKGLTREHDIVARTGGEEFYIVAPFAQADQIRPFAERICRMVGEMRVDLGTVILRPTISIGVAATSEGIRTAKELIKVSDERLYDAKETGRNKVSF